MKTYLTFFSFTLSLGLVFIISYLSSSFLEPTPKVVTLLYSLPYGIPSKNMFMLFWGIVYICLVAIITVSTARKCLRNSIKLWGVYGVVHTLFCFTYFKLNLTYLGVSIIIAQTINLIILLNFYVKNTRLAWGLLIPILALHFYSLFLTINLTLI